MSLERQPSSDPSSESLELSLVELDLLRQSAEELSRGLERWRLETFSRQSSATYRAAIQQRLLKLVEFLSSPSSTYTLTRSLGRYPVDTSTASSRILDDEELVRRRSNSSKSPPERQSSV